VDQFRQLPKGGEFAYELHHGEVVAATRPKARHWGMQSHLVGLLELQLEAFGKVGMEMPYRPVAEFDLRAADVAAVSWERFDAIDPEDNLRGAPELVIEVKSPSNTPRQLQALAALCQASGSIEFWILDAGKKTVSVTRRDGTTVICGSGSNIPLAAFGAGELAVDEIFG
jgi:Uma2 family endonuclease